VCRGILAEVSSAPPFEENQSAGPQTHKKKVEGGGPRKRPFCAAEKRSKEERAFELNIARLVGQGRSEKEARTVREGSTMEFVYPRRIDKGIVHLGNRALLDCNQKGQAPQYQKSAAGEQYRWRRLRVRGGTGSLEKKGKA